MTQKKYLKIVLVASLLCINIGGFLLHVRIHPVTATAVNYVPFIAGLMSILVISTMFFFKRLLPYAYLANGMLAIIGTITMSHFSYVLVQDNVSLATLFTRTIFPDIVLIWGAFFIGKALYETEMTKPDNLDAPRHKGRFFRYPNLGYWAVHAVTLSAVYLLGHFLWK